jgi:hypothetical protein
MRHEEMHNNQNEIASKVAYESSNRLSSEVHEVSGLHEKARHTACTNSFDDVGQVAQFGAGVVVGGVNGGIEFIEFITKPDNLPKLAESLANAIGTAGNYYADKVFNSRTAGIVKDVGDAANATAKYLEDYGKKDPYDRGKITGKLAADMLLMESGCELAKTITTTAKAVEAGGETVNAIETGTELVALQSNSDEAFANFVKVFGETDEKTTAQLMKGLANKDFASVVDNLAQQLPKQALDFLASNNIQIAAIKDIGMVRAEFAGADAIFLWDGEHRFILLAQNMHTAGDILNAGKLELSLRHELAHALDTFACEKTIISDTAGFRKIFSSEFEALNDASKDYLMNALGKGSEQTMRREVCAELVSRCAVPGKGVYYNFFQGSFPKLSKMLNEPGSPFRFE